MSEEEVQRVSEAIDAVERITDPEARVRAKSRIMAEQVRRNRAWSKERSELIRQLWDDGNGLSYREIATRLDIKLSTVQDVFRDYRGSGIHRPRADKPQTDQ